MNQLEYLHNQEIKQLLIKHKDRLIQKNTFLFNQLVYYLIYPSCSDCYRSYPSSLLDLSYADEIKMISVIHKIMETRNEYESIIIRLNKCIINER